MVHEEFRRLRHRQGKARYAAVGDRVRVGEAVAMDV